MNLFFFLFSSKSLRFTRSLMNSLVLPLDPSLQRFKGYLSVSNVEYGIEISLSGRVASVSLSPELAQLLSGLEKVVEAKTRACGADVSELVAELTDLCARVVSEGAHVGSKRAKRSGYFSHLVQEIEGNNLDIVDLSEQMDEVKLRVVDTAGQRCFCSVSCPEVLFLADFYFFS